MITPLRAPIMDPQASAASTPSQRLSVAFITVALRTPVKATTEPTDRSKSREARQNIIVQATMPIWETERAKPSMFCHVKKYWTESDKAAKRIRKIRIRLYSNKNASKRLQNEPASRDAGGPGVLERAFFVSDFMAYWSGSATLRTRPSEKSLRAISATIFPVRITMLRS